MGLLCSILVVFVGNGEATRLRPIPTYASAKAQLQRELSQLQTIDITLANSLRSDKRQIAAQRRAVKDVVRSAGSGTRELEIVLLAYETGQLTRGQAERRIKDKAIGQKGLDGIDKLKRLEARRAARIVRGREQCRIQQVKVAKARALLESLDPNKKRTATE